MSRIGKMPIKIPDGVEVKISKDNFITVKGKKGVLSNQFNKGLKITNKDGIIIVERPSDEKQYRSMHGLTRTLINNMIVGVSNGFEKNLEIRGVGYKAQKKGKKLVLNVGYSHPVELEECEGITIDVPAPNKIIVKGFDKQLVGQIAADIKRVRLPDSYKGKGIRYENEFIKLKEGKSGIK